MKIIIKSMKIIIMVLCLLPLGVMAAPKLNFTDFVSGPSDGIGDDLGSGMIVTLWGNDLGASQGTSTLTIGGVAPAHIYYWKNADGALPGAPSDMYSGHKMQEIAFSIPASLTNALHDIQVTVNGESSNTLPFTVRAGNIYHIKTTGNDSTGDGSWSNPWRTLDNVLAVNGKMGIGDTVYSHGVGSINGLKLGGSGHFGGSAGNPIAWTAYPDTHVVIQGATGIHQAVVDNWWYSNNHNEYIDISKIAVGCIGNNPDSPIGFSAIPWGRIVGVEITGPNVYGGYGGTISGGAGVPQGGKYLGIYVHNYGYDTGWDFVDDYHLWTSPNPDPYDGIAGIDCTNCTTIDRFQHLFYVSCRDVDNGGGQCEGYEVGWWYTKDNWILQGLHVYDMAAGTGWVGTISVHDNIVIGQVGGSIDVSTTDDNNANLEIYNNVIINPEGNGYRISSTGHGTTKIYNNTVYGQTIPSHIVGNNIDYSNNIIVDTHGVDYFAGAAPASNSNNLYYTTQAATVPTWSDADVGRVTTNPLFVDAATNNLNLQVGSSAIDAGRNVGWSRDLLSVPRPQGANYDIGAYEYQKIGVVIRADVDQNSSINSTDAFLTLRNSLGLNMSSTNWQVSSTTGDVNCDSNSNSTDALLILRESLGLDMSGTGWCG